MTFDEFEALAESFYRATGYMAPGKSVAMVAWSEDYEERRQEAWRKFLRDRQEDTQ